MRATWPGSALIAMATGWRIAGAGAACLLTMLPQSDRAFAADLAEAVARVTPGSTATVDHSTWDRLLKAYLDPHADGINRVAYARFKQEAHPALQSYIAAMERVDVAKLDRPEQFAFWANLYNAKTTDIVLDRYPVRSIKDINLGGGIKAIVSGGPWQAKVLTVMGQAMSLDDIENVALRPVQKDPRVHYAINCASIGCPNLRRDAFTGAAIQTQLDAAARDYVNHPRGFSVTSGMVKASNIYTWFKSDFGGSDGGVLAHARNYATPDLKRKLNGLTAIQDYAYDWSLIDAGTGS